MNGSRFCYRFFAPHENSLVGYDSLMKISQFRKTFFSFFSRFSIYDNFWRKKVSRFPWGTKSLLFSLFHKLTLVPIQQQSIILLETVFSLCISCFLLARDEKLKNFADFIYNSASKTIRKLFACAFHDPRAVYIKHFQGGHVIKCKQIS